MSKPGELPNHLVIFSFGECVGSYFCCLCGAFASRKSHRKSRVVFVGFSYSAFSLKTASHQQGVQHASSNPSGDAHGSTTLPDDPRTCHYGTRELCMTMSDLKRKLKHLKKSQNRSTAISHLHILSNPWRVLLSTKKTKAMSFFSVVDAATCSAFPLVK